MISAEEKRRQMLEEPVELLVCRLAVPTIITMMITAFYNMADTYFVGRLDTVSTAAVGIALPLMNIIQAMGFFYGHGSGNYMSGKLGAGDTRSAAVMGDTAAVLSLLTGALIAVFGLIFDRQLAAFLGADEILMDSTLEYISVLLIGVPFQMASFTMNNQLRFQGSAFYGMIGMAGGSVLNVILDPIFITVLGMRVRGAALATVISQMVSFVILLKMSGRLKLKMPLFKPSNEIVAALFKFGSPSLFRQGIMSVASVCLSRAAVVYGPAAIAAISVVNRIVMLGGSVIIGFGQGFQPVCGFNRGAGKYGRVKKVYLFCIKISTLFMTVFGAVVYAFAPQLIQFFRDDPEVVLAGTDILRFQCFTAPLQGVCVMTNMIMQNMGRTVRATILAIARQGLFFIPLLFILSGAFGFFGIQITQAAADVLSAAVSIPIAVMVARELSDKEKNALD
ncbi:MAG: MATE family efflux transporter [Huintestinicola sp.]